MNFFKNSKHVFVILKLTKKRMIQFWSFFLSTMFLFYLNLSWQLLCNIEVGFTQVEFRKDYLSNLSIPIRM